MNKDFQMVRPKVVRIVQSLVPSGRTMTMLAIHRGLSEHFDSQLWVLESPPADAPAQADRIFPHGHGSSPALIWKLARALRAIRPDIVHTHGIKADTYGSFAARLARVPTVISTCHRADVSQEPTARSRLRNKFAWVACNRIVTISEFVWRHLRDAYGIPERKLLHIYVGVPMDDLLSIPEQPAVPSDGRRILLCTCHLRPEKNHELLLKAFSAIAPKFPDTVLWLAGRPVDGHDAVIRDLAASLGIADRVEILSLRKDITDLLRQSALLVHPTRAEALGRSLIEASAAARPIVATRVGGIPEVVEDTVSGYLVGPDDVEGFAKGMANLLGDPALAIRMGAAGRKRARELFSIEHMTHCYHELYQECAGAKSTE